MVIDIHRLFYLLPIINTLTPLLLHSIQKYVITGQVRCKKKALFPTFVLNQKTTIWLDSIPQICVPCQNSHLPAAVVYHRDSTTKKCLKVQNKNAKNG